MDIKNMNMFSIETNEIYGRYLVASRDIKAGEIILKDRPIVIGPKINSHLVCINCYHLLFGKFHVCSKCKLAPLCGPKCENQKGDHTSMECQQFSVIKDKLSVVQLISVFHTVTILRCLILRNMENKEAWQALMLLEDHREKRKNTPIWELHDVTSKMIQNLDLLSEKDLEQDIIQKICGVLDVNSFELRAANNESGLPGLDSICGLYPTASLMAHSCVCNTHLAIDDVYTMTIRASIAIPKGSIVLFNYTNSLQGTVNRKEHLREGKYFECVCIRCSDATELGSHTSSLKCTKCTAGIITLKDPLNVTRYSANDAWICDGCQNVTSGNDVTVILKSLQNMEEKLDKTDLKKIECFISEASRFLHTNHYLLLDAKQHLAGVLRDMLNKLPNVPNKYIQRKLQLCKEFLPLLDILEPGISRLKAVTLYEVYYPLVQISNKEFETKEISSDILLTRLEEAEKYLKDSIKILLFEPQSTPEATLCKRAMEELRGLKKSIESVKIMLQEEKNTKIRRSKNKSTF